MTSERLRILAALNFPQLHDALESGRRELLAINADGYAMNQVGMSLEFRRGLRGNRRGEEKRGEDRESHRSAPESYSPPAAVGTKPWRIVFSQIERGSRNCSR